MDLCMTSQRDGRSVRLFNVIDDFNREALCIGWISPYPPHESNGRWSR